MQSAAPFRVSETHGILTRPENKVRASSDRFDWTSLYASAQRELPYEGYFPSVGDIGRAPQPVTAKGRGAD